MQNKMHSARRRSRLDSVQRKSFRREFDSRRSKSKVNEEQDHPALVGLDVVMRALGFLAAAPVCLGF